MFSDDRRRAARKRFVDTARAQVYRPVFRGPF